MGTTASTRCHVKNISIDQQEWNRSSSSSRGGASLPVIGIMFAKKPARPPSAQARQDKVSLIKRALTAEAKTQDFEGRIKGLERQLRSMELRNHDLSTELGWLQQLNNSTSRQVPNTSNTGDSRQGEKQTQSEQQQQTMKEEMGELREIIDNLRTSESIKELRIVELQRENEVYRDRVACLEDLCRDRVSEHTLANVSPSPSASRNGSRESSTVGAAKTGAPPARSSTTNLRRVSMTGRAPRNSSGEEYIVSDVHDSPPDLEADTDKQDIEILDKEHPEEDEPTSGDDISVADILNTSVRSTSQSLRSYSGKSRDSGYIESSYGKESVLRDNIVIPSKLLS